MVIDLLIIIVALIFATFGYKKGFIVQLINLIVGILYMLFSSQLLFSTLEILKQDELISTLENNFLSKFIITLLMGIILFTLLNLILKKIIKLKALSFINKLGGLIIGLVFIYLLICFTNTILIYFGMFFNFDEYLQQSFFLSEEFKPYNIIDWWLQK